MAQAALESARDLTAVLNVSDEQRAINLLSCGFRFVLYAANSANVVRSNISTLQEALAHARGLLKRAVSSAEQNTVVRTGGKCCKVALAFTLASSEDQFMLILAAQSGSPFMIVDLANLWLESDGNLFVEWMCVHDTILRGEGAVAKAGAEKAGAAEVNLDAIKINKISRVRTLQFKMRLLHARIEGLGALVAELRMMLDKDKDSLATLATPKFSTRELKLVSDASSIVKADDEHEIATARAQLETWLAAADADTEAATAEATEAETAAFSESASESASKSASESSLEPDAGASATRAADSSKGTETDSPTDSPTDSFPDSITTMTDVEVVLMSAICILKKASGHSEISLFERALREGDIVGLCALESMHWMYGSSTFEIYRMALNNNAPLSSFVFLVDKITWSLQLVFDKRRLDVFELIMNKSEKTRTEWLDRTNSKALVASIVKANEPSYLRVLWPALLAWGYASPWSSTFAHPGESFNREETDEDDDELHRVLGGDSLSEWPSLYASSLGFLDVVKVLVPFAPIGLSLHWDELSAARVKGHAHVVRYFIEQRVAAGDTVLSSQEDVWLRYEIRAAIEQGHSEIARVLANVPFKRIDSTNRNEWESLLEALEALTTIDVSAAGEDAEVKGAVKGAEAESESEAESGEGAGAGCKRKRDE